LKLLFFGVRLIGREGYEDFKNTSLLAFTLVNRQTLSFQEKELRYEKEK
jgi:hypothetical protein